MAEWLALLTSEHEVLGLNTSGGRIQLMTVWCFIARSLFIIIFLLSPYDLNNIEREVKFNIANKCYTLQDWSMFTSKGCFFYEDDEIVTHIYNLRVTEDSAVYFTAYPIQEPASCKL